MSLTDELKLRVLKRDKRCCRYCTRRCRAAMRRTPDAMTFDHVVPLTSGGKTNATNLVVACRWCNETKADVTLSEKQIRQLREMASAKGDVYARQLLLSFTYRRMRVRS